VITSYVEICAVLAEESLTQASLHHRVNDGQKTIKPALPFACTLTEFLIQWSWVWLCFIPMWLVSMHAREKWYRKWNHCSSVGGFKRIVRLWSCEKTIGWCTAQSKTLLLRAKTIVMELRTFEPAHLKRNNKVLILYLHNVFPHHQDSCWSLSLHTESTNSKIVYL